MKCPKCAYVSHDYLDACRKCSIDLVTFKQQIGLSIIQPGELDLVSIVGAGSLNGNGSEFGTDNDFLGTQMLVESEEIDQETEEEVDIRLDDDIVNATPEPNQAPGALTRQFFVPDELLGELGQDSDLADNETPNRQATSDTAELHRILQDPVTAEILNLDIGDETISSETFFEDSVTENVTDVIDMNELQELRDSFSKPESAIIEPDDISHDQAADVEPDIEPEDFSEPDVGQEASLQLEVPLDLDSTMLESPDPDETFIEEQLTIMDAEMSKPQPDMASEALAEPDNFQSQDPAEKDSVESNVSGNIQLPDNFQLEDFQLEDSTQEEEPEILDLPDQQDVLSATDAESDSDRAQPQAGALEEPEIKITLSLPIDPNTETLFFDELSEMPGPDGGFAPVESQDMPDTPVSDAQELTPAPIPLDDLRSEPLTDKPIEAESELEPDLGLPPPTGEHRIGGVTPDKPADTQPPEATEDKTQS
ncbi:MAG: hypothetical protein O7G88_19600 [bacterium]|nr:hypothetical protein [bacterium]